MPERKKGLLVESEPLTKILVPALHSLADWFTLPDHRLLPTDLGQEMANRGVDIAVLHANKPQDQVPVLSVLDQGLPVVVMARNEKNGAVPDEVKEMYQLFASLSIPLLTKPVDFIQLRQTIFELLEANQK